jgi:hypothetical protein
MLDKLDLVHMNGRVYDPLIARFMSAEKRADVSSGKASASTALANNGKPGTAHTCCLKAFRMSP